MDPTSDASATSRWQRSLATAIRDPDVLLEELQLPMSLLEPARRAAQLFPLLVPRSYLQRMQRGNPNDPLLRQVLPVEDECNDVPGFVPDAVNDAAVRIAPGVLKKYAGRALLIVTGSCAVHCRYCFRRHYPYSDEPKRWEDWEPAFDAIAADTELDEVILSGGDPLIWSDERLAMLLQRLAEIPQLRRVRLHSRLPIVLPDRVTNEFAQMLHSTRLTPILVVHANHAAEVVDDCEDALRQLVRQGTTTLNQAVLLRGINDTVEAQRDLSLSLINIGVIPYYVHQLDRVTGTASFEVPTADGLKLFAALRQQVPGYAVPTYVQEIPGLPSKTPVQRKIEVACELT